jgi:dihydroorotate dehydrogenase (NAD+) catalytic subunit
MSSGLERTISVQIGPVTFQNPVFLASGICGYGQEYASLIPQEKLGGLVTKTITLLPRAGNPPPRIHELPTGALNSIGLENVGLDAYVTEKLPQLDQMNIGAVVSITAETVDEFESMAETLAPLEGYQGIELNLSCPNVEGGLDHGRNPANVEKITSAVKKHIPMKSLWVKVTPNLTDIGVVARAAEAGGADAVSAINTLIGADFSLETGKPIFARVGAGYSGPGILPIALHKVWDIHRSISIPVIGIGGISSVEDARKFFMAGATAVQVGTAIYSDPGLPMRIVGELENHPHWIHGQGGRARDAG